MWAVAGRFHFSANEIENMPLSRLFFWLAGHLQMNQEERAGVKKLEKRGE